MNDHKKYWLDVPTSLLKVDKGYQRDPEPRKIKKIVKYFNSDIFNPPKVSLRDDGFYYVFDGQNSMIAHKQVFGNDKPINCKVYEGLTYDEEVFLFTQQNGVSSPVTKKEMLKAELSASHSNIKVLIEDANSLGITIDFVPTGLPNHIRAVVAVYGIWLLLDRKDFINVLSVIKEAWNGDSNSYCAGILKGLAYVYDLYGDKIKNKAMVDALKRRTPDYYVRTAADMKGSLATRFAKLFIEAYNYKKVSNRLEEIK